MYRKIIVILLAAMKSFDQWSVYNSGIESQIGRALALKGMMTEIMLIIINSLLVKLSFLKKDISGWVFLWISILLFVFDLVLFLREKEKYQLGLDAQKFLLKHKKVKRYIIIIMLLLIALMYKML